jgi:hypothetical protein
MRTLFLSRLTVIWLLLIGATLLSTEFVKGLLLGGPMHATAVAVLIVAFVKVRFVGLEFMELRHAPMIARLAFEAWLAVLSITLIAMYLLGIHV